VIGDALGVVAGGHGDDAAPRLVCRQREQLVGGAALLERGNELLIFQLEPDLGPGDFGQRARMNERRTNHASGEPSGGSLQFRRSDGFALLRLAHTWFSVNGPTAGYVTHREK
jgi:hypothetical protein